MKSNNFLYGSVLKLTRRDSIEDIERHFSLMKDCGMDTVVVWPSAFWWEEKSEDYPFATGKKLLASAEKFGIKIIMELAGQLSTFEYIPDFLMKKEYHPTTISGEREWGQFSFGFLNYFHPEVNELICDHYRKTAEAYKDFPALFGYDVFNETMFRSFDEYTIAEFRAWLREKYGSIDRLNEVWERTYSDFEQVEYEQWKWMSIMPEADYAAFRKACIGRFMKNWCKAIKDVDSIHPLIADNIYATASPKCLYKRPHDDFDLKDTVDEIGMSFYPKQIGGTLGNALRHEIFDAFYSASRREGFYVSEMQTHIQALHNPTTCVRPYELKRWCLESYAAGAKGLIYWMWRPFDKGIQTMGRGIVDYKDRPTERYYLAKELSETYEKYGVIKPLRGKVGVVYDPLCDDFQRIFAETYKLDPALYVNSLFGAYKALFDNNCKCDVILFDELDSYNCVILSNQLIIDKERADKLKSFVKNGGILIIDGRYGMVDSESLLNSELPGGETNELCGVDYLDTDYENLDFVFDGAEVKGYCGRELVQMTVGEKLAEFADGYPAVSRVKYGKGEAVTINTYLWYGYEKQGGESVKAFAKKLIDRFELSQLDVNGNVTVRVCENDDKYLIFIFNYNDNDEPAEIKFMGETLTAKVSANDCVILERSK
jgi:beta-galactosidase GanA